MKTVLLYLSALILLTLSVLESLRDGQFDFAITGLVCLALIPVTIVFTKLIVRKDARYAAFIVNVFCAPPIVLHGLHTGRWDEAILWAAVPCFILSLVCFLIVRSRIRSPIN